MRRRSTDTLRANATDLPRGLRATQPPGVALLAAASSSADGTAAQVQSLPAPAPPIPTPPTPVLRGDVGDDEFAPGTKRAFVHKASQEGIALYRHRGTELRVALVPLSANQVVSITIVYLVGSNAEVTGMTGSAHILEHELFKQFPGFNIWKQLGDFGARINASTSKTRTEFHCTVPAELFATALELESRRLAAAPLTGLDTEMTVVRNEYERGKNDACSLLREEVYRVALGETSTIGSLSDIEGIMHNADALRAFFRKYYCPANACVVVCGTFDPDAVLACIDQHFRHIEAGECTRDNGTDVVEPILPQRGVRSVDVAGEMPMGTLSFRAPDGVSREGVVLELLATWMSSGPAGPFAALLQDPELHAVDADFSRTKDVSLFTLWVSPISGGDATQRVERLQRAVLQAVLSSDPPCLGMTEDVLHGLKLTVDRGWQHEVNSTSGYAQQVVESFARCNSPFDVVERHHTLTHLTLADVQDTWRKVFVTFRMTLGRVLPELAPLELRDPTVTTYDVQGDAPVPVSGVPARALPWGEAVETPGGVYLMDATSPDVCVRVHIPCQTCGNSEATLRAALAMTGLKLDDGQVVKESQLHQEFTERGAHVSVTGTHAGLDVRLNAPADRDVGRLVQLLRAGIASPCVSQHDFARKQQFLGEIAVGGDYDVNTAARGLFSRVLFHDAQDPRRMASGADTSRALHGVRKARVVDGLTALSAQPAWVTCVAPSHAHLRAVRAAFEREGGATPSRDRGLQPPGVSPHAGRTVTQSMPGKTSCTMILGCASGIGAASEHALPLSLALDALGGGFSSRLMQEVREKNGLTYGINAASSLSDPSTTTSYVVGTFAPSLLEKGVNLSRGLVREWRERGISAEELAVAKTRALGSARVAWDAPSNVADALHGARLHFDAPAARCQSLADRVGAVTLQDCQRALDALPPFDEWVCVCCGAIPEAHTM